MIGDDKKLQVTLNVFKNLNTGGSFDEQQLLEELKNLETRMQKGAKNPFLNLQPMKSKCSTFPIISFN